MPWGTDGLHTSRHSRHESRPLLLAAPSLLHAALGLRSSAIHISFILDNVCRGLTTWHPMATDTEASNLPRESARSKREREPSCQPQQVILRDRRSISTTVALKSVKPGRPRAVFLMQNAHFPNIQELPYATSSLRDQQKHKMNQPTEN